MYSPGFAPNVKSPDAQALFNWVLQELRALGNSIAKLDHIDLVELHSAPEKLYTGLTVLADGTDWNPGGGAGVYTYYGAAWHKLG